MSPDDQLAMTNEIANQIAAQRNALADEVASLRAAAVAGAHQVQAAYEALHRALTLAKLDRPAEAAITRDVPGFADWQRRAHPSTEPVAQAPA